MAPSQPAPGSDCRTRLLGPGTGNVGCSCSSVARCCALRSSRATFRCPSGRPVRVANTNASDRGSFTERMCLARTSASSRGIGTVRAEPSVLVGRQLPCRMLRGGQSAVDLYARIFAGPVSLQVSFGDIVEYFGANHAVFAGRETGQYAVGRAQPSPGDPDLPLLPLRVRPLGAIPPPRKHRRPKALAAYQHAIAGYIRRVPPIPSG